MSHTCDIIISKYINLGPPASLTKSNFQLPLQSGGGSGSRGSAFSGTCRLRGTIQNLVSRLSAEQTQIIIYTSLSFLLGQLSFRVQFSSKVWFCQLGFQSFLWLSRFQAGGLGIITGVGLSWFGRVVGRVVRRVVRSRGLGFLLVWQMWILFPVSGVNILGLLLELRKCVQLSISFTDFIFEHIVMLQCTIRYEPPNGHTVSHDMGSANSLSQWII